MNGRVLEELKEFLVDKFPDNLVTPCGRIVVPPLIWDFNKVQSGGDERITWDTPQKERPPFYKKCCHQITNQ
jgi:hypothetical protein